MAAKYGQKATGTNAYAAVIAETGNSIFTNWRAKCATQDCIISFDGGKTDGYLVTAAVDTTQWHDNPPFKSVHAKNATADSNFTALLVEVS